MSAPLPGALLLVPQISIDEFKSEYELLEMLDRGTFSVVRKAVVKSTHELVAVKIVDISNFPAAEGVVQRELDAKRLREQRVRLGVPRLPQRGHSEAAAIRRAVGAERRRAEWPTGGRVPSVAACAPA